MKNKILNLLEKNITVLSVRVLILFIALTSVSFVNKYISFPHIFGIMLLAGILAFAIYDGCKRFVTKKIISIIALLMTVAVYIIRTKLFAFIYYVSEYHELEVTERILRYDVVTSIIIMIGAMIIVHLMLKFMPLTIAFTIGWWGVLIWAFVSNGVEVTAAIVAVGIILVLHIFTSKDNSLVIVLLVWVGIASLCGHRDVPYDWAWVKSIGSAVEKLFDNIDFGKASNKDELKTEISLAGFSGSGTFGDGLADNQEVQLVLNGEKKTANLYITGSVYNTYTNQGWKMDYSDPEYPENAVGTAEFLKSAYEHGFTNEILKNVSRASKYYITYREVTTSVAFGFNGQLARKQDSGEKCLIENNNLYYASDRGNGFRSYVYYIQPAEANTNFKKLLVPVNEASELMDVDNTNVEISDAENTDMKAPIDVHQTATADAEYIDGVDEKAPALVDTDYNEYNILDTLCYETYSTKLSSVINEQKYNQYMQGRKQYIQDNYLEVSDEIPERDIELAREITRGCVNDYEKVNAICEYLKSYTYTKTPQKNPDNPCVVDSFLFDTKEGYCVHFATSLAILSRAAGVPSRYVEGYCADFTHCPEKNTYEVIGNDAHAWAEVYLEGYGWYRMEATPGYDKKAYDEKGTKEKVSIDVPEPTQRPEIEETATQEDATETSATEDKRTTNYTKLAVLILVGIIGALLIVFAVYIILQLFAIRKEENDDRYKHLMDIIIFLLAKQSIYREQNETLREFIDRAQKEYDFIENRLYIDYEKVMYNDEPITSEIIDTMRDNMENLVNAMAVRKGKTRRIRKCLIKLQILMVYGKKLI